MEGQIIDYYLLGYTFVTWYVARPSTASDETRILASLLQAYTNSQFDITFFIFNLIGINFLFPEFGYFIVHNLSIIDYKVKV